jgi:cytochrome c553
MTRTLLLLAVSAALFTLPVTGWAVGSSATEPLNELERQALDPSREMIEQGRSVAQSACATCHGLDGISTAEGKPHLAGQRTVYLYRVLQAYQERDRKSNSMNHAADFLNKEALLAVSAYYANLPPARPEKAADTLSGGAAEDAGDPFAGIRDDMKKCIKCHGEDGNSSASGMPNLSAQDPVYFAQSMNAYVDGGRNHRMMERLVADLDESAIADMGVFYAVQPPRPTETAGKGDAAAGQAAAEPCANCHGADGNANGADMPTLAGQDPRYFVKAMKAYKDGKRQHEQMFEAGATQRARAAHFERVDPTLRTVPRPGRQQQRPPFPDAGGAGQNLSEKCSAHLHNRHQWQHRDACDGRSAEGVGHRPHRVLLRGTGTQVRDLHADSL